MRLAAGEVERKIEIQPLARKAGGRMIRAERHDASGGEAGLLAKLAHRAHERVLPALELAGGRFEQVLADGIAVLTHAVGIALAVHRENARPARMLHDLAERLRTVRQAHAVETDVDDDPLIGIETAQLFLRIVHG